jgi:hypothetical protein
VNAVVLCPGPSLKDLPELAGQYDLVLAVNRAVLAARCHWWCFLDPGVFGNVHLDYHPGIFTSVSALEQIVQDGLGHALKGYSIRRTDDMYCRFPQNMLWSRYSAIAAMVLAADLGATQIRVLGADMVGEGEFDGHPLPQIVRDSVRWKDERALWDQTVEFLYDKRIQVSRK